MGYFKRCAGRSAVIRYLTEKEAKEAKEATNECITYLLSNATVSYFVLAIKTAAFGGFPSYYLPFFFSERPPAEKKTLLAGY